jgi:hypothetical protein
MLRAIAEFGKELHFQINNNKIEAGKPPIIPFRKSLTSWKVNKVTIE